MTVNKVNILLVDDEPENLSALEAILESSDYNFIKATSGEEALKWVLREEMAVILMDAQMIYSNGFDTAKIIKSREKSKDIPIIFISAANRKDIHVWEGYSSGAVDYICKPFDPNALKAKVSIFVDMFRRKRKQIMALDQELRRNNHIINQTHHELNKSKSIIESCTNELLSTIRALEESEAKNFAILQVIPDLILWIDKNGVCIDCKPPKDDESYIFSQHQRRKIKEFIHADAAEKIMEYVQRTLKSSEMQTFEYQVNLNNNLHYFEARSVPLSEDEVIMIVRNITERKKNEEMKNAFISLVSHELRTPLTAIRGSLGLLGGNIFGDMPVQCKQLIDISLRNTERLIRLINDILDIEKIEAGKIVFNNSLVDLIPLIEQTIEANHVYAQSFGIKIKFHSDLSCARVYADSDRLIQVLTNFLSNACKFSYPDREVIVAACRQDKVIRVSVTDYGHGIPQEFYHQVFQKFAQASSSDHRHKGSGLGLSICKAIIERFNGGRIGFDSKSNAGTTFYFELPEVE